MANQQPNLPPGFRFHPTDEELVIHYLGRKLASLSLPAPVIADVNIYKFDPWELPDKAVFGEKEWYYFSPRDRKYPNGTRPNRAAASGYWKATGTDKAVVSSKTGERIGIRKVLVFYGGKPPRGIKTRWIMHEFRLADAIGFNHRYRAGCLQLDEWVLCRIYHKPRVTPAVPLASSSSDFEEESLVRETSCPKPLDKSINTCSFSNLLDAADLSFVHSILQEDDFADSVPTPPPWTQINTMNRSQATLQPVPNSETGLKRECPIGDHEIVAIPSKKLVCHYRGSAPPPQPRALCTSSPFLHF